MDELDRIVKVPGLANIWVPPIRNRIDMLATGIKSRWGSKLLGPVIIDASPARSKKHSKTCPRRSALAERLTGGRYVDVNINRDAAAMNIADVQSVTSAVGRQIGETVEGFNASPSTCAIPVRSAIRWKSFAYAHHHRARPAAGVVRRGRHPIPTASMLRSENARLSGWVYVDIRGRDLRSAVQMRRRSASGLA